MNRHRTVLRILIYLFLSACVGLGVFVAAVNLYMVHRTKPYVCTDVHSVPPRYVAIVLGARAYENNVVSFAFRDRIAGGMDLLEQGTVQKVLVSGDHGRSTYDEVNAARSYIMLMYNVDGSLIFLDHAGFSTYDTMYRARDVFCVTDAVVVTQQFHLARSLYIARTLGIDAVGYAAPELNPFRRRLHAYWQLRESLARVKAFLWVAFRPKPRFLGEELPITGDGHSTWDIQD